MENNIGILNIVRNDKTVWRHLPEEDRTKILSYRGFDGLLWQECIHKNMDLPHALLAIESIQLKNNLNEDKKTGYWILHTENLDEKINESHNLFLTGYDVGIIDDAGEDIYFSGIFNEVRDSGNKLLKSCAKNLNNSYLFETIASSIDYLNLRKSALSQEDTFGIETAYLTSQFKIIKIYQITNN